VGGALRVLPPGRATAGAPEELLHEPCARTRALAALEAVELAALQIAAALPTLAGPPGQLSAGGRQGRYSRPADGGLRDPSARSAAEGVDESNASIIAVVLPSSRTEADALWIALLGERSMSVAPHCQQ